MKGNKSPFNLAEYFLGADRMRACADSTAIEFNKSYISYKMLRVEVGYWQEQMRINGVKAGDRVALLLFDSPEFIAAFLAAVGTGAIAVPVNTYISPQEVDFILADCQPRLVIIEGQLENVFRIDSAEDRSVISIEREPGCWIARGDKGNWPVLSSDTDDQTPAFLLYTSGSTGVPKGVLHVHGSIPYTVETYSKNVLRLRDSDRLFSASRLFFAYGLGNSLSFPLAAGATVILESERPNPELITRVFAESCPTIFFGVPAVYNAMLEYKGGGREVDTSSLRLCISAGEALPARVLEEWRNVFGLTILDGIGSTEMLHIFLSNREDGVLPGSSGRVVQGYEARLLDDSFNEVVSGEPGNLWIQGKSATSGYWGRPDLTGSIMRGEWVKTGDIYRLDDDGYFHHIGRSDDCFKVSGLWVSPIEVESVLLMFEGVSEAAVIAGKDEDGLATVLAYVVIRKNEEQDNLKTMLGEFLRNKLPRYKVPSSIEFLDSLPRTSTGKIQRFKLRK